MGVRISLAAPRFIEYDRVTANGRVSPSKEGYHIVPVYNTRSCDSKHHKNMKWIEESLTDSWTWFVFGGYPKPGISYCFKSKVDAGMFVLCREGDFLPSIDDV